MLSTPASMDKSGPSTLERILRQVHAALICRSSSIFIRLVSAKVATLHFLFSRHSGLSETIGLLNLCLRVLSKDAPRQMHLEPKAQGAAPLQEHAAAVGHSAGWQCNAMARPSPEDCGLDLGPLGNFLLGRCVC